MNKEPSMAVLIFAKLPRLGNVKTRLQHPPLTVEDVYALYEAFLWDTIVQSSLSNADTILLSLTDTQPIASNELTSIPFFDSFMHSSLHKIHPKAHIQPEGTFGERMKHAIQWSRDLGYERLVVLGADSPHIQPNLINQAFHHLRHKDVVLGPSPMGGIYLIGLKSNVNLTQFELIFDGVELVNFANFITNQGSDFFILSELTDIDTQEDLIGLIAILDTVDLMSSTKDTVNSAHSFSVPKMTYKRIKELRLAVVNDQTDNRNKMLQKI